MAPSPLHQGLVEAFELRPSLAPELIRELLDRELPAYDDARIESAELRELTPAEVRADLVVVLVQKGPVLAIVVEVQLAPDPAKRFTWPLYVVGIRRRLGCDACLLVVTPDDTVATWAQKPIHIGPGGCIEPLVIGPGAIPIVRDAERARRQPDLAFLSALAHRNDPEFGIEVVSAALEAAVELDEHRKLLYSDLVFDSLNDAMRAALEKLMQAEGYKYQSWFAKKHQAIGRAEGKAEDIVRVLEARQLPLSSEQRARILGCGDLAVLDEWLVRAATVGSIDEVFGD